MTNPVGVAGLEAQLGIRFEHIAQAREWTQAGLARRRDAFALIPIDPDVTVCLMGSWGRLEATPGSDDDFMVLLAGTKRADAEPRVDEVAAALQAEPPGREETFGGQVWLSDLTDKIGRDQDTNANLTRRMLTILESVAVVGDAVHSDAQRALIDGYLAAHARDYQPPRFLLNDLIRYWRTIAVDFEGKMRDRGGEGWGLRNAKLRLSRKALFAGGLLPVLDCSTRPRAEMSAFLQHQMSLTPLDRIAQAFLAAGRVDPASRAFAAYDTFLGILRDPVQRAVLDELSREEADGSELLARIKRLGSEFEMALLSLLFDDDRMLRLVQDYLIF